MYTPAGKSMANNQLHALQANSSVSGMFALGGSAFAEGCFKYVLRMHKRRGGCMDYTPFGWVDGSVFSNVFGRSVEGNVFGRSGEGKGC